MSQPELLKDLLQSLGWSQWRLITHLGEHETTVHRWFADLTRAPVEVVDWLEYISAPLRLQPTPEGLKGKDEPITPDEVRELLGALLWTKANLYRRLGVSAAALERMLAWRKPFPPKLGPWLRQSAQRIRERPLPEGWKRRTELVSAAQTGMGRPRVMLSPKSEEVLQAEEQARSRKQREEIARKTRQEARRQRSAELRDRAWALREQGKSWHQIGAALDCSHTEAMRLWTMAAQDRELAQSA